MDPEAGWLKLVSAGIIPVLLELFDSLDTDVQYYGVSILASVTRSGKSVPLPSSDSLRYPVLDVYRQQLAKGEPRLVEILVQYMDSSSPKVQSEAARTLRNLTSSSEYQLSMFRISCSRPTTAYPSFKLEIVKAGGLNPLLRLLQSPHPDSIDAAVSLVLDLTDRATHRSLVIKAGFLQPLVKLLSFKGHENVHLCAAQILSKLAASPENRRDIFNAGAVQSIKELVLEVPVRIQIEMTRCIKYLSKSGMHSPFHRLP